MADKQGLITFSEIIRRSRLNSRLSVNAGLLRPTELTEPLQVKHGVPAAGLTAFIQLISALDNITGPEEEE